MCATSILLSNWKDPIPNAQIKTFIVVATWYLVEWWIYRNRIRLVRMRKFQKPNHITIAYFHTFQLLSSSQSLSAIKRIMSTRKSTLEKPNKVIMPILQHFVSCFNYIDCDVVICFNYKDSMSRFCHKNTRLDIIFIVIHNQGRTSL